MTPFAYFDNLSDVEKRIYLASDRVGAIRLHDGRALWPRTEALQCALAGGILAEIEAATKELCDGICASLRVIPVKLKVASTRPSSDESELHGLYTLRPRGVPIIRVWMRTARLGRVVAFKTFLRTVLHELCHHLDFELLDLPLSFHTQGFFKRESSLFHQLVPRAPINKVKAPE